MVFIAEWGGAVKVPSPGSVSVVAAAGEGPRLGASDMPLLLCV